MQIDPRQAPPPPPPKTPWGFLIIALAVALSGLGYYFRGQLFRKEEVVPSEQADWKNPNADAAPDPTGNVAAMSSAEFNRKIASLQAAVSATSDGTAPPPASADPRVELRASLEGKLADGSATVADLRTLLGLCKQMRDAGCQARVQKAIKGE